jgi:predicted nucleotidyltransferase component of viral defense system
MYYLEKLYPFQDKVLSAIERLPLDFYLTGGTALGRCYLQHRYSDDLDFFVNDHKDFKRQCAAAVKCIRENWDCEVAVSSASFVRLFAKSDELILKVDFVNDVPAHFGDIRQSGIFHRVDSWRNILSNKLCALSRLEIKDIVDIVFIARSQVFEWEHIINEAREKDLWVDPIEICRFIDQFPVDLLETIKWAGDTDIERLMRQIDMVHNDIFIGAANSLAVET